MLKNSDFQEVTHEGEGGEVLLRFAIANGFRNIQNLVQKMKRKKCNYDFVEVMACPSGCLNGGAQSRPAANDPASTKAHLAGVKVKFEEGDLEVRRPEANPDVAVMGEKWLEKGSRSREVMYTEYHEVEKMTNSLAIKW